MSTQLAIPYNFTGQVAIVTGGGRGLGRAFALALAKAGAAVAVTARTISEVDETAALITRSGGKACAFAADVTDFEASKHIVADVEASLGPVTLLANNAAIITPLAYEWDVDPDEWWNTMTINVRGSYLWIRAVMPGMMARKRSRIINMSSSAMFTQHPYSTAYLTSKSAIATLSFNLAGALKQYGVSVFAFSPGGKSSMIETIATSPNIPENVRDRFRKVMTGEAPDNTASSVKTFMFLASGKADRLSGRYFARNDDEDDIARRADEIVAGHDYMIWRDPPVPGVLGLPRTS